MRLSLDHYQRLLAKQVLDLHKLYCLKTCIHSFNNRIDRVDFSVSSFITQQNGLSIENVQM